LLENGSVAVWCKANRKRSQALEAHFNYWHIRGDRSFNGDATDVARDFLEIGLWAANPTTIDYISIFVPLICSWDELLDCSQYLSDAALAEGIFNEPLIANPRIPTSPLIELRKADGQLFVSVFDFSSRRQRLTGLTCEEASGGTIITITRNAFARVRAHIPGTSSVYFRLRIYVPDKNPFIKQFSPRDWYWRTIEGIPDTPTSGCRRRDR